PSTRGPEPDRVTRSTAPLRSRSRIHSVSRSVVRWVLNRPHGSVRPAGPGQPTTTVTFPVQERVDTGPHMSQSSFHGVKCRVDLDSTGIRSVATPPFRPW